MQNKSSEVCCCSCYSVAVIILGETMIIKETLLKVGWIFTYFLLLSSGLKARSNVISYVTVNDSPDSDSSLSSPYSTDTLSALRGNSGPLVEGPGRVAGDGTGTRTIIVPPLKTQLGDCTGAAPASGEHPHSHMGILCRCLCPETCCFNLLMPTVATIL